MKSRNASKPRMWCESDGSTSGAHAFSVGLSAGAVASRLFLCLSLVRMTKWSPWWSTSYSCPDRRGATSSGSAQGSDAGISRTSDVTMSPALTMMYSLEAAADTLTKNPGSSST